MVGPAEVADLISGVVQSHFGHVWREDEMRHPQHAAISTFQRRIEVLAALKNDLGMPAARPVSSQTLQRHFVACAAEAGRETVATYAVSVSERGATRMDDRTSDASMERRKKEGYF